MPKPEDQHIRNRSRLNPGTALDDDPLRSPNGENPPELPDDYNAPPWAAEVPGPAGDDDDDDDEKKTKKAKK